MKKGIFILLLILVMGSLVFAGGKGEKAVDASATEKIIIWTNLTADAQAKVLNKQFTEVAAEMGVEVEMVTISFNDMYTKLATAVESGNVPDIMHTNFAGTAYLHSQGIITEMDDVIAGIGKDDFIASSCLFEVA
jgi:multiple sugar transport system substrate-binding protein